MNNPLARYRFVDDHGHLLENCVEYRELLAEVERLRREVEMLNKAVNGWQDEYESAQRCADIVHLCIRHCYPAGAPACQKAVRQPHLPQGCFVQTGEHQWPEV